MKIVINPKYKELTTFVKKIPDNFNCEGELIYSARNQIKVFKTDDYKIVVKSFCRPHLFNAIAYTFLRKSKAERSYRYALKLLNKCILTPEPIAYIEEHCGVLLMRSFYLSVFAEDYEVVRPFMSGDRKNEKLLRDLAAFVADLHMKEINFLDLSPGNVLQKTDSNETSFMLVDINRMRFEPLAPKKRAESFKRLVINGDVRKHILQEYARLTNQDENFVQQTMDKSEKFFKKIKK